ncbi:predicted protein [Histoplasma capsulatum var. duboisii H88]|uniref:Predicted protein n=1 Tax=Ajellomyces capsulatus (strain H88) TaxID=544711 RepID=F0UIG2_AJEC8|nr:predicted protein [Histoplasma capsulatum var. duboisii H88]
MFSMLSYSGNLIQLHSLRYSAEGGIAPEGCMQRLRPPSLRAWGRATLKRSLYTQTVHPLLAEKGLHKYPARFFMISNVTKEPSPIFLSFGTMMLEALKASMNYVQNLSFGGLIMRAQECSPSNDRQSGSEDAPLEGDHNMRKHALTHLPLDEGA